MSLFSSLFCLQSFCGEHMQVDLSCFLGVAVRLEPSEESELDGKEEGMLSL